MLTHLFLATITTYIMEMVCLRVVSHQPHSSSNYSSFGRIIITGNRYSPNSNTVNTAISAEVFKILILKKLTVAFKVIQGHHRPRGLTDHT